MLFTYMYTMVAEHGWEVDYHPLLMKRQSRTSRWYMQTQCRDHAYSTKSQYGPSSPPTSAWPQSPHSKHWPEKQNKTD